MQAEVHHFHDMSLHNVSHCGCKMPTGYTQVVKAFTDLICCYQHSWNPHRRPQDTSLWSEQRSCLLALQGMIIPWCILLSLLQQQQEILKVLTSIWSDEDALFLHFENSWFLHWPTSNSPASVTAITQEILKSLPHYQGRSSPWAFVTCDFFTYITFSRLCCNNRTGNSELTSSPWFWWLLHWHQFLPPMLQQQQ